MGTTLITPKQNGSKLKGLTTNQISFVEELLANNLFSPTEAAKAVGYKNPSAAANKLMKNTQIAHALGKAMRERSERCELKADDVLHYLQTVLYFNPLHWFRPTSDGKWEITDLNALPEEVGRLIEGLEVKVRDNPKTGATESTFKVTLVSKATALGLAMRHVGVDKLQVVHTMDWDKLLERSSNGNGRATEASDIIEEMIKDA